MQPLGCQGKYFTQTFFPRVHICSLQYWMQVTTDGRYKWLCRLKTNYKERAYHDDEVYFFTKRRSPISYLFSEVSMYINTLYRTCFIYNTRKQKKNNISTALHGVWQQQGKETIHMIVDLLFFKERSWTPDDVAPDWIAQKGNPKRSTAAKQRRTMKKNIFRFRLISTSIWVPVFNSSRLYMQHTEQAEKVKKITSLIRRNKEKTYGTSTYKKTTVFCKVRLLWAPLLHKAVKQTGLRLRWRSERGKQSHNRRRFQRSQVSVSRSFDDLLVSMSGMRSFDMTKRTINMDICTFSFSCSSTHVTKISPGVSVLDYRTKSWQAPISDPVLSCALTEGATSCQFPPSPENYTTLHPA